MTDQGKIIIIDDDDAFLKDIKPVITKNNWKCELYSNPVEALERVKQEQFDVILLDIIMPGITGIEFMRRIKSQQIDLDVICITAYGDKASETRDALRLGAFDYILKPFDLNHFVTSIQSALSIRQIRRRLDQLHRSICDRGHPGEGLQELMEVLVEKLALALDAKTCIAVGSETGTWRILATFGWDASRQGEATENLLNPLEETAKRTTEPIIVPEHNKQALHLEWIESLMVVPMLSGSKVLGALFVGSHERDRFSSLNGGALEQNEKILLSAIARLGATAIEQTRNATDLLKARLDKERIATLEAYFENRSKEDSHREIIGGSKSIQDVLEMVGKVASIDTTVLIQGERGTGKELIARAIHLQSPRKDKPFIVIDCNIPEALAESELFGVTEDYPGLHQKKGKMGLLEAADGGTVFLDEVGELPHSVQSNLLRVIQEKEIRRTGANHPTPIDVRFVAATNRDLKEAMDTGKFRKDLYDRLNVFPIEVPPLRERKADLPQLIRYFLDKKCQELERPCPRISDEAFRILYSYSYPGNVREQESIIERALILAGDVILPENLKVSLGDSDPNGNSPLLDDARIRADKEYLEALLIETKGNVTRAAEIAGVTPATIRSIAKKTGVKIEEFRTEMGK
jgi:DNA-binding NtrC family response regulator